jgi:hypothetical protein
MRSLSDSKTEQAPTAATALAVPLGAMTIAQFCASNGISRSRYFEDQRAGLGPKIFKNGAHTRISIESAAEWRAQRTAAAEEERQAKATPQETESKGQAPKSIPPKEAAAPIDVAQTRAELTKALAAIEKISRKLSKVEA